MDLNLDDLIAGDLGTPVRGRDLTVADLSETAEVAGPIKRLRVRHHTLAREVALGTKTDKQIAIENGYTPQTLVRLRTDPAFMELVDFYDRGFEAIQRDAVERLKDLSIEAMEEVETRLQEDPDQFSIGQLMELTKLTTDRTGLGPTSSQNLNVNVGLGGRLDAAADRMKTIDITPEVKE